MLSTLGALIPTFGLVITGFILKKTNFPGNQFWPYVDKLTYYILLPALLIVKLAVADLDGNFLISMMVCLLGATSIIATYAAFKWFKSKNTCIGKSLMPAIVDGKHG